MSDQTALLRADRNTARTSSAIPRNGISPGGTSDLSRWCKPPVTHERKRKPRQGRRKSRQATQASGVTASVYSTQHFLPKRLHEFQLFRSKSQSPARCSKNCWLKTRARYAFLTADESFRGCPERTRSRATPGRAGNIADEPRQTLQPHL